MSPAEAAGTPYGAAHRPDAGPGLRARDDGHALPALPLRPRRSLGQRRLHRQPPLSRRRGVRRGLFRSVRRRDHGAHIAASVDTPTPTLSGTAGNARGDSHTVTVRLYNGGVAAGRRCRRSRPRAAALPGRRTAALAPGQYTAQATQANARASTASARPTTFTVAARRRPAGGGGSSSQQSPRRQRQRRHPRRPGHLGRLAAAGPRQDVRRARGLGRRLHQVPARHRAAGGGQAAEGLRAAEGRGQRPDGRAARHAQGPRRRDVGGRHEREPRRRRPTSTTASSRSSRPCPRRSRRSRRR